MEKTVEVETPKEVVKLSNDEAKKALTVVKGLAMRDFDELLELVEKGTIDAKLLKQLANLSLNPAAKKKKEAKPSAAAVKKEEEDKEKQRDFTTFYTAMKKSVEAHCEAPTTILRVVVAPKCSIGPATTLDQAVRFLKKQEDVINNTKSLEFSNYVVLGNHYNKVFDWWKANKERLNDITWECLLGMVSPAGHLASHVRQVRRYRQLSKLCTAYPRLQFVAVAPFQFLEHIKGINNMLEDPGEAAYWRAGTNVSFELVDTNDKLAQTAPFILKEVKEVTSLAKYKEAVEYADSAEEEALFKEAKKIDDELTAAAKEISNME